MAVIKGCLKEDSKELKKLVMMYWEVVKKYDAAGKLLPEMILVRCCFFFAFNSFFCSTLLFYTPHFAVVATWAGSTQWIRVFQYLSCSQAPHDSSS